MNYLYFVAATIFVLGVLAGYFIGVKVRETDYKIEKEMERQQRKRDFAKAFESGPKAHEIAGQEFVLN